MHQQTISITMPKTLDVTGERYGRLTAIAFARKIGGRRYWSFACDCGNTKEANLAQVRHGKILSCGCIMREHREAFGQANLRHGMSRTPTYKSWLHMVNRCTNSGRDQLWKYYGARGIKVCERWMVFDNFFADMGERPAGTTIDRVDVNGHYEPGNCRWATFIEQCNNRRTSRVVTFRGQSMTMAQLAKAFGIPIGTMWYRLENGWTVEDAATIEVKVGRNQFTPRDF